MKLIFSLKCALITVFLTVCMIDSGEAMCPFVCSNDYRPVCGGRDTERRTFDNQCKIDEENDCGRSGGGWELVKRGAC
uniref:Secreted peptide n=1 Tax=Triatoma brasiliensis TaxID=65344 RepID=A0MK89_TRIBS|nr:secreted peptide [Triatoma brasiliensis]